MIRRLLFPVAFAILALAQGASAHHNMTALFDFNDRVTLKGTLTKVDWRNPHAYLTLDVKNAAGAMESWSAEGPSPTWFRIRDVGKADFESTIGKVFPSQFDPANAIETASDNSNSGSGTIQRQEKISLTIAATVAQVLPNGNMVIQGTQEVKTNNELRQLTVSGIVRPEDITAANTIRHTQIAEARINYGGRGDQSRVQRTPAGQALVEQFSPF